MVERFVRFVAFVILSLLLIVLVLMCGGCQSTRPIYEIKAVQEGAMVKTEVCIKGTL